MLEGRDWFSSPSASAAALDLLKATARVKLPESYFALLSHSNGREGPLPVQPFNFCLYPVEEAIEIERERTFQRFFPEFFVVGGNGGGEAIGFDLRGDAPFPIVAVDMTNIDLDESILLIAPSFEAFVDLIGVETECPPCQRRSKNRPRGGAKVRHLGRARDPREGVARAGVSCAGGDF